MSHDPSKPVQGFSKDWDLFLDLEDPGEDGFDEEPDEPDEFPLFPLLTAAYADLVAILVPATAALIGLRLSGLPVPLGVAPWTLGLGLGWWLLVAAILLRVRRGTPGLLAAGLAYREQLTGGRLWGALALALLTAATLGIPLIFLRKTLWQRLEELSPATE